MKAIFLLVKAEKKETFWFDAEKEGEQKMILAGDIGGTHTRLALFEKGRLVGQEHKFASREEKSLEEIIQKFLQLTKARVEKGCFGVAGPVRDGVCKTTNLPWVVDRTSLRQILHANSVFLLNDLEANAWGLQVLKREELYCLQEGKKQSGNQAMISAGTGLGEAGLFWDGKGYHPFACEGGHTDFGPRDEREVEILLYLKKKFGHVSYERLVSGPGLYTLFLFLVETGRAKWTEEVKREMESKDPAKVISAYGMAGKDPACVEAVDWFISLYGAEAGNVALKFLSLGGLYIGGGIAPQLKEKMKTGSFLSSFVNKGRFQELLSSIPIWIVLNDNAALLGAAYYAEQQ